MKKLREYFGGAIIFAMILGADCRAVYVVFSWMRKMGSYRG